MTKDVLTSKIIPLFILFWGAIGIANLIGKWSQIGINPFEFITFNDFLIIPIYSIFNNYFSNLFVMTLLFIVNPFNPIENDIASGIQKYNSNSIRKNITRISLGGLLSAYPLFMHLFDPGTQKPFIYLAFLIFFSLIYLLYSDEFLKMISSNLIRNIIVFGIPLTVIAYGYGYEDGYSLLKKKKYYVNLSDNTDDENQRFDCFLYYGKLGNRFFLIKKDEVILLNFDDKRTLKIFNNEKTTTRCESN